MPYRGLPLIHTDDIMIDSASSAGHSLGESAIAGLLQKQVKPIFLLGAGASFRSGIPLVGPLVEQIAKWGFCQAENRHFTDDPTVMRSDWDRWLTRQSWYRPDVPAADLYPTAVERVLRPQVKRREFFRIILRPKVPPSPGYRHLARLLAKGAVQTILTTNFDRLVAETARMLPEVPYISEVLTPDDLRLYSSNPTYPQVVHLHGSVDHYTDQNIESETQALRPALVDLLRYALRDHPLVVIGYRGWEPSVMRHLLIDQAEACDYFAHGIYWCQLPGAPNQTKTPLLKELESVCRGNLQYVEIVGFDELMSTLEKSVLGVQRPAALSAATPTMDGASLPNDLQLSGVALDGINETLLSAKLIAYYDASRLNRPDLSPRERFWEILAERSLASRQDDEWKLTRGAQLLFAKNAAAQLPHAKISVVLRGPAGWIGHIIDRPASSQVVNSDWTEEVIELEGDLWAQLEQASDLLARVNRPFRLKGPSSQDVYPYPPLALKELLTNLLAHRDYMIAGAAIIHIDPGEIYFNNPGGLVENVRVQLDEESIQSVVTASARQVKGYRNPVIADFFFSAGAMDKEGSGLPDVVHEAGNNLNEVSFGPTDENRRFVAQIKCRPEALTVDAGSGTAKTNLGELRYSPNLLHITRWPEKVLKVGTIATPKEIAQALGPGSLPFALHRGWVWTFASEGDPAAARLMLLSVENEVHVVPSEELLADPDAWRSIPRLLNSALAARLVGLGMYLKSEPGQIRAYFPAEDGLPREMTYKGRFKTATRTVAKPIVSRSTGKTVYWEHKAVSLRFERFGSTWTLALLPSYIFTEDGRFKFVAPDRIGPLTTKRASRDYNPSVLHDMVFWSRIISGGAESVFNMEVAPEQPSSEAKSVELAAMIPTWVFQESVDAGLIQSIDQSLNPDVASALEELNALQDSIEELVEEDRGARGAEHDEA
jgi:NAD-dependent SIR2 family protein deacetylase